jgi:site-specific DNA-cytosine methylase
LLKLLIGGSPCRFWSIAKNGGREKKAEGMGWDLFENYLIAKEKFQPDFFLYENNWSASKDVNHPPLSTYGA